MNIPALFGRVLVVLVVFGATIVACGGRSNLLDEFGGAIGPDGGLILPDGTLPPGCGNSICDTGEDCTNCAVDCGLCKGCGDGTCQSTETCSSCPHDCGVCSTCGDGFCKDGETCLSCAPDCGICPGCGDNKCDPKTEDCFSCPKDCGNCPGCGDGLCKPPETCASCAHDCGVCAVCGNNKCEPPFETCQNCHQDCGDCTLIGCPAMLTCALGCVDVSKKPPAISVTCVADCVSRGCPSAQFFFDQAFNCFIAHIQQCGTSFDCLSQQCQNEIAACFGATRCPGNGGG